MATVFRANNQETAVFLDHEQRAVPPPWEPPSGKKSEARRRENAAIALILLVSVLGLFAPVAGGTIVGLVLALLGH